MTLTIPMFQPDEAFAYQLDAQDDLASFRTQFVVDDPNLIYLLGNSLGRLPHAAASRLQTFVNEEWGKRLIRGWNEGWFSQPNELGAKIAHLIGAHPDEVIIADSTSVNLFKLALAAVRGQHGRTTILTDNLNFPSDLYILSGVAQLAGPEYHLQLITSPDEIYGPVAALQEALNERTALLSLSATVFKSSYSYDMAALTAKAHEYGALVLWDLSHATGAIPLNLAAAEVDLAVGCTYKYLCGGPGSPAFLYVRRALQEKLQNPISGWIGQNNPFALGLAYEPAPGIQQFLTGTPSMLSLVALEAGVDLLLQAGMERVRAKSVRQTEYIIYLWEQWLEPLGFCLKSPREARWRGSHVALGHPEGLRISRALKESLNVLPDFRKPDNLRFAAAPLFNSYHDIYQAVIRLRRVMDEQLYTHYPTEAPVVT
ncbi:MAG: kynureninase [Chloroflexi bacterium]|nr:kynureninase [Chloroflexota bacterium]